MNALLSVRNVSVGYTRETPVLKGVSLDVVRGWVAGLVGPNGSGKTTLVRAASRALRPSEGQVLLDGGSIWSLTAREFARQVAVVPQEVIVPFDQSALEIVMLGRHPHVGRLHLENSADEEAALRALKAVAADHLASRSIRRVSGGERQRVMIAKALVQEPKLLILDEPTAHLDIAHQIEVLSLVSGLARERGISVLAVLHDLNLAAAWCDWMTVLHGGTVAAAGVPGDVITESLLARVWQARAWVRHHPITGRPFLLPMPPPYEPDEKTDDDSLKVHVVCGGGSGGPVLAMLMREGYKITCGVVNVGDSDEELCRSMNIPHTAEAPFSPISSERAAANLKMALEADVVVLTDFCVGSGNLENLRTVDAVLKQGKRVIQLAGSEATIDYTGGEGARLLARIAERAVKASTAADLPGLLV